MLSIVGAKAMAAELATWLTAESRRAAEKAKSFEETDRRNDAFRALGIAEGLRTAAERVRALADTI
jgi:hypothetical protein